MDFASSFATPPLNGEHKGSFFVSLDSKPDQTMSDTSMGHAVGDFSSGSEMKADVADERRSSHKHYRSTDDPSLLTTPILTPPSARKRARFQERASKKLEKSVLSIVPSSPQGISSQLGFGDQPLLGVPKSNKKKRKISLNVSFPKPSAPDGTGVDLVPRRDSEPALMFQTYSFDDISRTPAKKPRLPMNVNPESRVAVKRSLFENPSSALVPPSTFLGPFASQTSASSCDSRAAGAGDPTCWTEDHVSQWVLGTLPRVYHRYVEILRQNGVDGELLFQLEDSDLATFIELPLHRKKFLVEISRLRKLHNIPAPVYTSVRDPDPQSVMEDDTPSSQIVSVPKAMLGGPTKGDALPKPVSRKSEFSSVNIDPLVTRAGTFDDDGAWPTAQEPESDRENVWSSDRGLGDKHVSHVCSKSDTAAVSTSTMRPCREGKPSPLSSRESMRSSPGYTYFGELSDDSPNDRRSEDTPQWNVVSCPDGHPRDQMVACFIDNSTLALEAATLASEMRGISDDNTSDSSMALRLDFGTLLTSICESQSVPPCCLAVYIYGITPCQRDSVWRPINQSTSRSFVDNLDDPFQLTRSQFLGHNGCAHVEKMMRNDLKYAPYHGYRHFVVVNSNNCDFSFAMSKVLSIVSATVSLWCWDHTLRDSSKLVELTEVEFPLKTNVVSLNERLNDLISIGHRHTSSNYHLTARDRSSHSSCFGPKRTHPDANRSIVLKSCEYTHSALLRWLREEICLPNQRFKFQEDGACLVIFDVRLSADEIGDIFDSCGEHIGRATSWSSYYHSLGCPNLSELHPRSIFDPLEESLVLRKYLQSDRSFSEDDDLTMSSAGLKNAGGSVDPLNIDVESFVNPECVSPSSCRGGTRILPRVRSVSPISSPVSRNVARSMQKPKSHSLTPPRAQTGVAPNAHCYSRLEGTSCQERGRSRTRLRVQAQGYSDEKSQNLHHGHFGDTNRSSQDQSARDTSQQKSTVRKQQKPRKLRNCIYGKYCRDMNGCTHGLHSSADHMFWQMNACPRLPKKTNDCVNGPTCVRFLSKGLECSFRHDGEQYYCCLCDGHTNHHSKHCDKRFKTRK